MPARNRHVRMFHREQVAPGRASIIGKRLHGYTSQEQVGCQGPCIHRRASLLESYALGGNLDCPITGPAPGQASTATDPCMIRASFPPDHAPFLCPPPSRRPPALPWSPSEAAAPTPPYLMSKPSRDSDGTPPSPGGGVSVLGRNFHAKAALSVKNDAFRVIFFSGGSFLSAAHSVRSAGRSNGCGAAKKRALLSAPTHKISGFVPARGGKNHQILSGPGLNRPGPHLRATPHAGVLVDTSGSVRLG